MRRFSTSSHYVPFRSSRDDPKTRRSSSLRRSERVQSLLSWNFRLLAQAITPKPIYGNLGLKSDLSESKSFKRSFERKRGKGVTPRKRKHFHVSASDVTQYQKTFFFFFAVGSVHKVKQWNGLAGNLELDFFLFFFIFSDLYMRRVDMRRRTSFRLECFLFKTRKGTRFQF